MKIIYKYFFCSFFLFLVGTAFSQNAKIDSLKIELQNHEENDTTRVNLLNDLAFLSYRKNIDTMVAYIDESEEISKTISYKKGIARCTYLRGVTEMYRSNFDKAINYLKKASQLFGDINKKKGLSDSYMCLGATYYYQSNYEKALFFYKKAEKIRKRLGLTTTNQKFNIAGIKAKIGKYEEAISEYKEVLVIHKKNNDQTRIANCLNSIASAYQEQGNISLSLEYHNESLSYAQKLKDSIGIARSFNNIGNNYMKQYKYSKALDYFFKALSIFKRQKNRNNIANAKNNIAISYVAKGELNIALKYLNESIKIGYEINDNEQIASCLNNLGHVYITLENYNLALDNYLKAKTLNIKIDNKLSLCSTYIGLAKIFFKKNLLDKSLENILSADKISRKLNLLSKQRDVYQLLTKIYKNTNQFKKALISHQQFKMLSDSLFNKKNIEKITQLEYEYKYKQVIDSAKIREQLLKKTVTSTNENLEKSQRNLLLGVIAFLVTALIMGTIIFFLKLRNEKSKTQNIVIEQKLLRSQMTPHFIFNSLSVLQGMILNKEENKSVSYLSKFSKLLRTILENSRHKTVVLSEELSAIESYMTLQNLDVNPPYDFNLTVASNIDKSAFKIPPMLIQPFIENAIEHAFPNKKRNKKISVDLSFKNKELVCIIKDNGVGVNLEKQKRTLDKKSLATAITSERLEILSKDFKTQGSMKIENKNKDGTQGTLVTLVVPYKIAAV